MIFKYRIESIVKYGVESKDFLQILYVGNNDTRKKSELKDTNMTEEIHNNQHQSGQVNNFYVLEGLSWRKICFSYFEWVELLWKKLDLRW